MLIEIDPEKWGGQYIEVCVTEKNKCDNHDRYDPVTGKQKKIAKLHFVCTHCLLFFGGQKRNGSSWDEGSMPAIIVAHCCGHGYGADVKLSRFILFYFILLHYIYTLYL